MDMKRLLPLSGIAFVALVVVSVVAGGSGTPESDASGADLASFYDQHTVSQGVLTFVLAATVPFLVLFGIGLAGRDESRAGRISPWGQVVIAGTILTGVRFSRRHSSTSR